MRQSASHWRRYAAALAASLAAVLVGACGPLPDYAALQERAALPAARPSAGHDVVQTFVAGQPGLSAVELRLAVYPAGAGAEEGDLIVRLREATGDAPDLGLARVPIGGLRHNAWYRLAFAPQPQSQGREYQIVVESTTTAPSPATVWMADGDLLPDGALYFSGELANGDLTFRAYYDYELGRLVADLRDALLRHAGLLLVALILLLLPGLTLQRWLVPGLQLDAAEAVGAWLGLSIAVAPVALLAVGLVGEWLAALGPAVGAAGGRVDAQSLIGGLATLVLLLLWRELPGCVRWLRAREGVAPDGFRDRLLHPSVGAFLATGGALVLRYVHAKDLALPMWVDSVHHTLIADLIVEGGRVPIDYGPFVPAQPFTYHFGFHTQVAFLHWLTGVDIAAAVLFVGQLLSGLVVLPTYLLVSRITEDRRAGLLAGLIAGLVSTMPAYYVSWGRYPQLAGLLVLPVAAVLVSRLASPERRRCTLIAASLAVAGQVLTHPRVALLLAALVLADFAVRAAGRRPRVTLGTAAAYGGTALGAGALLVPWFAQLSQSTVAAAMGRAVQPTLPDFPIGLITAGADRYLLACAALGVVVGVALKRRDAITALLWVAFSLLAANPYLLGLPVDLMLSNDALAIALYLPIALLVGTALAVMLRWVRYDAWPLRARLAWVLPLLGLGIAGGTSLAGIANPACLLATTADVEALAWVRANTPPDAVFLINARRWQYDIYAGTDGGYWLPALAGRRASLPPLPYAHASPEEVASVRRLAALVEQGPRDAAALRATLLAEGISHVYVGALGGPLRRDLFMGSPGYRQVYSNGRAWVFEVLPGE